ncbi:hypothetical protein AB1Y20_003803 [Prymnesium parvum]|uniref:Uncharacterized protein n=1 Tax=Prymnesium parvum TaxID=97485 RepID=A0AB34J7P2_PRYPA
MRSFEAAEHGSPPSRCSHRLPHEDGALFGRPHSQRRPYARHHELSLPPNRPPSFCLSKNYASPEQHALRASAVCLHSPADSPRASPDARSDRAARTWTPPRPSEFHDASDRVIPSHALGDNLLPSHIPRSDDPRRLYLSPYETSSKLHHERRNGSRQLDDDAVVCTVLPAAVCLACLIIGVVLGYTLRTMTGGEGCALPPVHPKQTNCPLCPTAVHTTTTVSIPAQPAASVVAIAIPMQPDPPARPPEQPPSPPTCDLGSRRDTRADLSEPHSCEELSASAFVCDAWYDSYSSFAHRVQLSTFSAAIAACPTITTYTCASKPSVSASITYLFVAASLASTSTSFTNISTIPAASSELRGVAASARHADTSHGSNQVWRAFS